MSGNKRNVGFAKAKQSLPADNETDADTDAVDLSNSIVLDADLASTIKTAFTNIKNNREQVCKIGRQIRVEHMVDGKYPESFKQWFKDEKLDKVFGSEGYFSRHASIGDVFHYLDNVKDGSKYKRVLPPSVGALYETSKICDYDKQLFLACFTYRPERTSTLDQLEDCKQEGDPVISESATEASIRSWFTTWKQPRVKPKDETSDKMTIKLLTIYASTDLYLFDAETGLKTGDLDLEKVDQLKSDIEAALENRDTMFKLEGEFDSVKAKYNAEREKLTNNGKKSTTKKSTKKSAKK